MLQPEKVQQGRVEVVEMNAIDGRLVPNVVGFSVGDAAFDTPSRKPGGEAMGVAVTSRFACNLRRG